MQDAELVRAALKSVRRMGLRAAGDALGVSHDTVRRWRGWDTDGGPLAPLSHEVRARLEDVLGARPVDESPSYADGVRYAIGRMEEVLEELRALTGASGGPDDIESADSAYRPEGADAQGPRASGDL